MTSFSIVQISDTHLSRTFPQFLENFQRAADFIARAKPDLVVHTGDLCVEAPDRPEELAFVRRALDGLMTPWRAVPGNHDVGDNPDQDYAPTRQVSAPLLEAWREVFGPDRWTLRQGEWTLIGLNGMLFNSGLDDETAQYEWLVETLDNARGPVAIFSHKPLMLDRLDEVPEKRFFFVPTVSRPALAGAFARADVRLFASGHVHQARDQKIDGIRHVWAPPTSFTLPDTLQPTFGQKTCGLVRYGFTANDVTVEVLRPQGMASPPDEAVAAIYAAE